MLMLMKSKEKRRCVHLLSGVASALPCDTGWHLPGVTLGLTPTWVRVGPTGSGCLRPQHCSCPCTWLRL